MKLALPLGEECEIVVSKQRVGSFPVETTLFFHLSHFSPSLISQICLFFYVEKPIIWSWPLLSKPQVVLITK